MKFMHFLDSVPREAFYLKIWSASRVSIRTLLSHSLDLYVYLKVHFNLQALPYMLLAVKDYHPVANVFTLL